MDKKVVILGLDGVAYTFLVALMRKGYMPNLASIVRDGTFIQIETTIPDISCTAWTSFMTGRDPGGHGIFGFTDVCPYTYGTYFTNSMHISCECLWDSLARFGKRCVILNVPATYPARPINGVLIAGFVAPDLEMAVYPKAAYEYLKGIEYRLDVDTRKAADSRDHLIQELNETLEKRIQAIWHFWESEQWDLFMAVLTETDRINHFCWDAWEDERHPYHWVFIDYYKQVDRFLGTLYDRFLDLSSSSPACFTMISDHGFTKAKAEVYLNYWLKEVGLLASDSSKNIVNATMTFALDQGRIYINRCARGYSDGTTTYQKLQLELLDNLWQLKQEAPFLKGVFCKEDIYSGPLVERAPDLILLPKPGFILKGGLAGDALLGHSPVTGTHTQDDAFFFISGRKPVRNLKIHHIASLILKEMGLPNTQIPG